MNTAPKLNYQEFIKDIYNGMKKISVQYDTLLSKLGDIETRLSAIESSQIYLGTKLEEQKKEPDVSPSSTVSVEENSRLLNMLDLLEAEPELPPIYKYTTDVLATGSAVTTAEDLSSSLASYNSSSPAHEELTTSAGSSSGFLILED